MTERVKVLFINKFGPSSNAITGKTANELATFLVNNGVEVEFLSIKSIYRATVEEEARSIPYRDKKIGGIYDGDNGILRLLFSLLDGFRLLVSSLGIKKDIVIVMTEPPLLFFWFQLFRWTYKAKLVYWTMDVYPEAFVSSHLTTIKNIGYKFFSKIVYSKPPDFVIALGDEQRKFLANKFKTLPAFTIMPCGIVARDRYAGRKSQTEKIIFGYSGNLGSAHDPEFLLEIIHQLDPENHHIILSLYGTKASIITDQIPPSDKVSYRKSLTYDEIATIDINIASLLPEWNHVCVPSKAVSAICCSSPLLLNAESETDNWVMLQKGGWRIEPSSDYKTQIRQFLQTITPEDIQRKREEAYLLSLQLNNELKQSYQDVLNFVMTEKQNRFSLS